MILKPLWIYGTEKVELFISLYPAALLCACTWLSSHHIVMVEVLNAMDTIPCIGYTVCHASMEALEDINHVALRKIEHVHTKIIALINRKPVMIINHIHTFHVYDLGISVITTSALATFFQERRVC